MDIYERMKELDITLPKAPEKGGSYSPAKRFGSGLIYISGCGPAIGEPVNGRVGRDFTAEQGKRFARNSMLNVLAVLEREIGDLRKVKNVVKILTFVESSEDFLDQPVVANGGSGLLEELWGSEMGLPARSAIGVYVLPGNIPVETEAIFEVEND